MARLDRDMPDGYAIPSSYSTVDEQEKLAGAQQPGYGGNVGSSVTNQVSNEEYPTAGLQTGSTFQTTDELALKNKNVQPQAPEGYTYKWIGSTANGSWQLYKTAAAPVNGSGSTGVPGLAAPGSKIYQLLNGKMYYDGALFTGEQDNAKWVNGIKVAISTGKDADGNPIWKAVDGGSSTGGGGQTYTASDGKTFTDQQAYVAYENSLKTAAYNKTQEQAARQSAYDLLYQQFNQYGLGSLVEGIKGLIQENVSPSEFAIRLQNTDAYKQRFAANQDRIKQGLRALTPAEYIGLEDQYQNIMRNYGLPSSYYSKDAMGTQAGFNKFISNDVSAAELEDRIATAQKRVINADPNVTDALRQFYPDITNSDILAYTLDPTNALENIKRKVTAAEIGGAALGQGLGTNVNRAEELAKYGITKAQAQQGYGQIGEFLPTATKLGDIYQNQGLGAYDQGTAESEVFGTAGSAQAAQKRKKLAQLEQAQFGGSSGTSQTALDRGRQGSF